MITLKKEPGRDFIVLNLTDTQLGTAEWEEGHVNRNILVHTVTELVERVKPNLITISGDLSWAGHMPAYEALADFLDSFAIPWAPVWGNHDNQDGPEFIDRVVEAYSKRKYFLYEKGEPSLGNGNYVISIEENGRSVEGIIMIDTHDRAPYTEKDGNTSLAWAKMTSEQIDWYKQQVHALTAKGCKDTMMIMHIPIYAYRQAIDAAIRMDIAVESATLEMFLNGECWNEEYRDTIGVQLEGVCSYPGEDGVFDVISELNSTKHVIAGHDHVNNWMIHYKGVNLIYGLKTGAGCYWNSKLNGGTVIRISSDGVSEVYHEYVSVAEM